MITGHAAGAVGGEAAQLGGANPQNLGNVTPLMEGGHVEVRLTVIRREESDLVVVKLVANDVADLSGTVAGSDVLTVAATTLLTDEEVS